MVSIHSALIEVCILNNVLFHDIPALIKLQSILKLISLSKIKNMKLICRVIFASMPY